ncbi:MAG: hypothetical protein EAZ97_11185 [Bacteroidetes bacterium]|nr:MAG: hypothetical protein EAZ97_11185 [Bacteroidota bacterium]
MGKQINLYIQKKDIEKIQNYLLKRKFVWFQDEILLRPEPLYTQKLFNLWETSGYLALENTYISYRSLEQTGQNKFRIDPLKSEVLSCTFFAQKEDIYHLRFYFPQHFIDKDVQKKFKNPDFSLQVDRFFRWLRAQFKPVPDMPTFYYNPDFAPKEWF